MKEFKVGTLLLTSGVESGPVSGARWVSKRLMSLRCFHTLHVSLLEGRIGSHAILRLSRSLLPFIKIWNPKRIN